MFVDWVLPDERQSSIFKAMIQRVVKESKVATNRLNICSGCWVWIIRGREKCHKTPKKRSQACEVITKKTYSVNLVNKSSKDLTNEEYFETVKQKIIMIAKNSGHFDERTHKIKVLEDETNITSVEDTEPEKSEKSKKLLTPFEKKLKAARKASRDDHNETIGNPLSSLIKLYSFSL